jgi:hypothetical protein
MRTAAICPTCPTYTNALCTLYNGSYLSNVDVNTLDSLEEALQKINSAFSEFNSKKFIALVSQNTGVQDLPVLTVIRNDFSGTITPVFAGVGEFELSNTLPEFTVGKTTIKINSSGNIAKDLGAKFLTTQALSFKSRNGSGVLSNDILSNDLIEVDVYL